MHKQIISIVLAVALMSPVGASAATLSELNIQVAELLAKVFNLKAQLSRINTSAPAPVVAQPSDLSCLILDRYLAFGDKGYDVTSLQLFLARNSFIYPEALITGNFGAATQRAVQRFQVSQGIIAYGTPFTTGYGVVGPKTRSKMQQSCPVAIVPATATSTVSDVLVTPIQASVIAGGTPFNSKIHFTLSDKCVSFYLDWGDGTAPLNHDARDTSCNGKPNEVSVNHVYPRSGVYTVVLRAGKDTANGQLKLVLPTVSYKAIVAGGSLQPFSLSTIEGPAPLSVTANFTLTHPACTSYSIDWGDTKMDEFEVNAYTCSENIISRRIAHVYDEPGTYDLTFKKGQGSLDNLPVTEEWLVTVGELAKGKTVVELTDTSGRPPLTVKVSLSSANGHCTSYDINWGDGASSQRKEYVAAENSEFSVDDFITSSAGDNFLEEEDDCIGPFSRTFTHTYVTYGVYPLKVKLGKGLLKDIDTIQHWISVFAR